MFGFGNGEGVSDADASLVEATKFITSSRDRAFPRFDSNEATWLSFALDATNSFIPAGTPRESSFELVFDVETDWTLIPIRPVPAKAQAKARTLWQGGDDRFAEFDGVMHVVTADGPRYQMVGNSFAVPVLAWIGRRIQMVEDLAS